MSVVLAAKRETQKYVLGKIKLSNIKSSDAIFWLNLRLSGLKFFGKEQKSKIC
jgi:hypothetical protein